MYNLLLLTLKIWKPGLNIIILGEPQKTFEHMAY